MGEPTERTILRIRCSKQLFRKFKKIAADYDNYELTLDFLLTCHEKYGVIIQNEKNRITAGKYR